MQENVDHHLILPTILCVSNNQSVSICINEQCSQHTFICSVNECQCSVMHKNCHKIEQNQFLGIVSTQHKQLYSKYSCVLDDIQEFYDQMIEDLSKHREKFMQYCDVFGLGQNTKNLLSLLNDGLFQAVSSKLVNSVIFQNKGQQPLFYIEIQNWKKTQQYLKCQFSKIIKDLQSYQCEVWTPCIDSKIFNQCQISNGEQIIRRFLQKPVKNFNLLYRASQQQFSAFKFHEFCDGIENTLVLAQTNFDKIIGGFTPIKWGKSDKITQNQNLKKQTFLFSVTLNEKYQFKGNESAIIYSDSLGPIFGSGFDFLIGDRCHQQNMFTCAKFPTSFNNGRYERNQASFQAFSGQKNGYQFRVKEYEVFQVVFDTK